MTDHPHLIIFNPDQWRGDVLGHMGNRAAVTPTLDRLVETDAVSFRNAFCQNPVCTPSRCSFMTGWYPHVRGHRTMFHMLHAERGEPNLLRVLRAGGGTGTATNAPDRGTDEHRRAHTVTATNAPDRGPNEPRHAPAPGDAPRTGTATNVIDDMLGARRRAPTYHVWWGGKNDLVPAQFGFAGDCDVKFAPTDDDYRRWGHAPRHGLHGDTAWRGEPDGDNYYSFFAGRLDTHGDSLYSDSDWAMVFGAIDAIRNYDGGQPLCLYLPLLYPHPPYGVEEPFFSAIDRAKLPPRPTAPESWEGKPALLQGIAERQRLQGWTEERWAELRATYYGMCARVDHQLGLIIDALKDKGLYDDTALFVFADHGDFTGDYGLVEKTQNTFEDCLTRVPFVVKPPRSVPVRPRVSDALVELIDFPATVYDLLGIEPGYTQFGRSLLPVIAGERDEHRDAVFCEGGRLAGERQAMELESASSQVPTGLYWPRVGLQSRDDLPYHGKAAMCRTAEYKYVRRLYETDELYDLRADPHERRNVIHNSAYAKDLAGLKERMLAWYLGTCDVVPFDTDER